MKLRSARLVRVAIAAAAALLCASTARATTLTFEELNPNPNPDVPVPATVGTFESYAGFTWKDGRYAANFGPGGAFAPGFWLAARGHVTAYVPGGTSLLVSRPTRFGLVAAWITSAGNWSDTVLVEGLRGGAVVYTQTITTGYLPARFAFNFADLDAVRITARTPYLQPIAIDDVEVEAVIDTVPPTLALAEAPAVVTADSLWLSGRAYDQDASSAGLTATVTVSGVRIPFAIDPATGEFRISVPLQEGANPIAVEVTDAAGNVARSTLSVTRDSTPPTIRLPELPSITSADSVYLSGQTWDQDGYPYGLTAAVTANGVRTPVWVDPSSGSFAIPLPLQEGPNEILVEVADSAGNVARRAVTITRDSIAPRLEFLAPAAGAVVKTFEFPVSVRVDDATVTEVVIDHWKTVPLVNGVATTTMFLSWQLRGPFAITVQAIDAAGNESWAMQELLAAIADLAIAVDVASGSAFGPLPGDLLPIRITVDGPVDATVDLSTGGWFPVPAGGAVIDALVPLVEGPNAFTVTATSGGNVVDAQVLVTYDTTPPSALFVAPSDGSAVRGTVEVALETTDASSAVAAVSFSVDGGAALPANGGPIWTGSVDLGGLEEGPHAIVANVTDAVGNGASASVSVIVDATPPTVSLVAPLPGGSASGTIAVSAEASDATSGVRAIRLLANGVQIGACEASPACSAALDTTVLPDGPFVVAAVATDLAGNEALAQAMVIADNSAPSRFLLAPAPGQIVAGSFEVEFDVQDPGFAWAECVVGGVAVVRSTEPSFRRTVEVTGVPDGSLEVACTAADTAGNQATETVTVIVGNWTLTLDPRVLATSAKPGAGAVVTLYVEGPNVALLAPASARALALAVPGGSPAPLVRTPAADQPGDADRDGIPDLTLKFERAALLSAIRGGVAAGVIAPGAPVTVRLVDGDRLLGATTVEVR